MKNLLFLCIFLVSVSSLLTEIKLPVKSDTQQKLGLSLQKLSQQLSYFRTPYQNKTNLYKRVALTEQYLQQLSDQLSQYNNVIAGQQNSVDGSKNFIVGSFNTLKGNDNYVFIQKYTGQANGDLLIGKWRIQIEKKKLILVNSTYAISFINQETNRKYLRFLTEKRTFSYGSSNSQNVVTFVKDEQSSDSMYNYGSTYQYSQNTNYGSNSGSTQQQVSTPLTSQTSVQPSIQSSIQTSIPQQPQFGASQTSQSQTYQNQGISANYVSTSNTETTPISTTTTVSPTVYQSRRNNNQIAPSTNSQIKNNSGSSIVSQSNNASISQSNSGYVNNNFQQASKYASGNNLRYQPAKSSQTVQTSTTSSRYYRPSTAQTYSTSTTTRDQLSSSYSIPVVQPSTVNLATWRRY